MSTSPRSVSYRLLEEIGRGFTARVFLAERVSDATRCALKVFEADASPHCFLTELQVLASTTHPNLVQLVDFGETVDTGQDFLAVEYFQAQDFVSASRLVSQQHFYSMIVQALRALDYLHSRGFVHGDVKPDNLLVSLERDAPGSAPVAKLTDFGFARYPASTNPGIRAGTPPYIAPEVIQGASPSPASDLYSFGAVLLECLAGSSALVERLPGGILCGESTVPFPSIDSPTLGELQPLLRRLLSPEASHRPSSAADVIHHLSTISPVGPFKTHTSETWDAVCATSPLVGRNEIVARCHDLFSRGLGTSPTSRATCILLVGQPGAGGTRLSTALAVNARSLGIRVITLPAADILQPNRSCLEALSAFLQRVATSPVLLMIDSAGYAEGAWQDCIRTLCAQPRVPQFVLLTAHGSTALRDADEQIEARPLARFDLLRFDLPPLDESHIGVIIESTMHVRDVDPGLTRVLHEETGGNPFLVVHRLAGYLDQGIVSVKGGSAVHSHYRASSMLPPAISGFLQKSLRNVSGASAALLSVLAVSGYPITLSEAAGVSLLSESDAADALPVLLSAGVACVASAAPEPTYSIAGSLLADAVVERLPEEERRRLHERLASRCLLASPRPDSLERAARHLLAIGSNDEALQRIFTAAQLAERESDFTNAARLYRAALRIHNPQVLPRSELALGLARALARCGQQDHAQDILINVVQEADLSPQTKIQSLLLLAHCARKTGDFSLQERTARAAIRLARRNGTEEALLDGMLSLGSAKTWMAGQRQEGHRMLIQVLKRARHASMKRILDNALLDLAAFMWHGGRYDIALKYTMRRLYLARRGGDPESIANALQHAGILHADLGLFTIARKNHRESLDILSAHSAALATINALGNIGDSYQAQGQFTRALAHHRAASTKLRHPQESLSSVILRCNMAFSLGIVGHYSQALGYLRRQTGASRSLGSSALICNTYLGWAFVLIEIGRPDIGHRVASHACRLADQQKLSQLLLIFKTYMAQALEAMGKADLGGPLLEDAIRQYEGRAPFEARLRARIIRAQIGLAQGQPPEKISESLSPHIETSRRKRMRWHLGLALLIRGQALGRVGQYAEAESALRESLGLATKSKNRTMYWQAAHALGRVHEQMLHYEAALEWYRRAANTIHELAMNIEEERYRSSFTTQPRVRDVLEAYDRLAGLVGRRVKRDLAVANRSEMISRKMLNSLSAIGQKMSSTLDLDELMAGILDSAIDNVRAERGMIFLRDPVSGEMRRACVRGVGSDAPEDQVTHSTSVVRRASQGEAILTIDVGSDPTLAASQSVILHEIKSILCVPMRARGKVAGVIYFDTRRGHQLFTEKERAFVESFASQAAIAIENARLFGDINAENLRLRREAEGRARFENLIGTSPAMTRLTETISSVLGSDCNVLISGESGTGKELVARAIHYNGPRRKKKFVAIDCGALPESLLEAELFGYGRGAFTGADRDRLGLIEEANGGTLFLDEITNTSVPLQAKLLRVLQDREVRRLGENTSRRVDVRLVSATNADLQGLVSSGRFRQDLYYRLNVVNIVTPPLRERREDIPLLAAHFLKNRVRDDRPLKRLGPGVADVLSRYDWPGNVRELENLIERLVVLTPASVIAVDDLPEPFRPPVHLPDATTGPGRGEIASKTGEHLLIEEALRRCRGDKSKAARYIGWNRQKLYRRMKEYGIPTDYGKAA